MLCSCPGRSSAQQSHSTEPHTDIAITIASRYTCVTELKKALGEQSRNARRWGPGLIFCKFELHQIASGCNLLRIEACCHQRVDFENFSLIKVRDL